MSATDPREGRPSPHAAHLLSLREEDFRHSPVELVPISSLVAAESPRTAGEDSAHVHALAESEPAPPPILVHRPTRRVIDGMHRLRAARLRGHDHIAAHYFDGAEGDIFPLAVAVNVAHGLPLSLTDRMAAAERIFQSHPQWSDRAVAQVAGLSTKKVSEIRRRVSEGLPRFASRIGRDGRVRPLNCAQGRALAGELIKNNPEASTRQIAKQAGISPATAADVRNRLRMGLDPVPTKQRGGIGGYPVEPAQDLSLLSGVDLGARRRSPNELTSIFESLRRDPSLRFNELGRIVLRMFDACAVVAREQAKIVENLPPHCAEPMAELVQGYMEIWRSFAAQLQQTGLDQQTHP